MTRLLFPKKADPTICSVPGCASPRGNQSLRLRLCDVHINLYRRDPEALKALADGSYMRESEEDVYTAIGHAGAFDALVLPPEPTAQPTAEGVILQPRTGRVYRVLIVDCTEDPALSYAAGLDALTDRVHEFARTAQIFVSD